MQQQHTSLNSEHVESLAYKAMNDLNFAVILSRFRLVA